MRFGKRRKAELPAATRKMHLVLFFTRGLSLKQWHEIGMLDRETSLYKRLAAAGVRVSFVTYGDSREIDYADGLPGISILANRWRLPSSLYSAWLPLLHGQVLRGADLFKTNQTDGGLAALRAAKRYGKPLIARCGYMWSEFQVRKYGEESQQAANSIKSEAELFSGASKVVVTTEAMKDDIRERLPGCAGKTRVIPNYVDTDLFSPPEAPPTGGSICFVGQLKQQQKNLAALVEAVKGLDVDIDIIGEGAYRRELELARVDNPRINLLGSIPHADLPGYLQSATLFVFPSFNEGHPKTLIEAMACGCPVVTTRVPGIQELVRHGETGWLCDPTGPSIREGIKTLLADTELRKKIGTGAREFAQREYALPRIMKMEQDLYQECLADA